MKKGHKPIGKCAYCSEKVSAKIIERSKYGRDLCDCPKCHHKLSVCSLPACDDYARAEGLFANPFCGSHTKSSAKVAAYVAVVVVAPKTKILSGIGAAWETFGDLF